MQNKLNEMVSALTGKRVLILTTSTRWDGQKEEPKSTKLARFVADRTDSTLINVADLNLSVCEGNVSTEKGNLCGTVDSTLKDSNKNPSGYHRCWASLNNEYDELWKVTKPLFEADVVLFFVSVRWGQTNSIYQKLIERLNWIENRWTTLKEDNIIQNKAAGIVLIGHNWNGDVILETQKNVLRYYGFNVPSSLSFNWQWTKNALDESAEGYEEDPDDFRRAFGFEPKFLSESYERWFYKK